MQNYNVEVKYGTVSSVFKFWSARLLAILKGIFPSLFFFFFFFFKIILETDKNFQKKHPNNP